jgi:hypothetical protein
MPEPNLTAQTFHERFTAISAVARELQAVVREMATNLFPVDASVRRIGRRLDLRVNLAWKFGRMLRAEEVPEIVAAIPGGRGRRTLLDRPDRRFPARKTPRGLRTLRPGLRVPRHRVDRVGGDGGG